MTRRGMTLVEMLVATTATLILMAAVAQVFSVFGSALSDSRSMVELDARMRTVASRLRSDLTGATARPLPPLDPQAGEGYFEIIEGPRRDLDAAPGTDVLHADVDDVLLFTTRNSQTPFVGRAGAAIVGAGSFVESTAAEVAWFLRASGNIGNTTLYSLYRRQLLVVGYAGFPPFSTAANTGTAASWVDFYNLYDLSVRLPMNFVGNQATIAWTGTVTPNTLSDLTRREFRFLHHSVTGVGSGTFPFPFVNHTAIPPPPGLVFDGTPRAGEDIVLTNVIAFDVKVFDPVAGFDISGDVAVVPGDMSSSGTVFMSGTTGVGAYVDLGYNGSGQAGQFADLGKPVNGSLTLPRTFDTWSTHYDANGINEDNDTNADGSPLNDEGSDGLDNNSNQQVDEAAEQETSAPYPRPLRGVEVRIRCYEPSSRQVRQVTIRHTFVPH
jgi:prepilin-type N-terminal cleavage/methylation domain-containing protein